MVTKPELEAHGAMFAWTRVGSSCPMTLSTTLSPPATVLALPATVLFISKESNVPWELGDLGDPTAWRGDDVEAASSAEELLAPIVLFLLIMMILLIYQKSCAKDYHNDLQISKFNDGANDIDI
jgi:hypothetical protein